MLDPTTVTGRRLYVTLVLTVAAILGAKLPPALAAMVNQLVGAY